METHYINRSIKLSTFIILIAILIIAKPSSGSVLNKPDNAMIYTERKKAVLSTIINKFSWNKEKQNIFFNGITLKDAVCRNREIDNMAIKITENLKENTKDRAYALYEWITENIKYEHNINAEPYSQNQNAGAIYAFNNRKGGCFDFSALFSAMCISAGIRCRLITGLAYTGAEWTSHAWNSFYIPGEKRWAEVDTTFGTVDYYFDSKKFESDHISAIIQGEWK